MTISFTTARRLPANAAVVAYGIKSDELNSPPECFNPAELKKLGFKGELGQVQILPEGNKLIAAVGLGESTEITPTKLRTAAAALARATRRHASVATDLVSKSEIECIYCDPEVAFAGLTEESAKSAGYQVSVSKHRYSGNGRAMILGETEGLVKVVAEADDNGKAGRILGVHMAGPWVTEQLGQAYLAVNLEATVDEIATHIQAHPLDGCETWLQSTN